MGQSVDFRRAPAWLRRERDESVANDQVLLLVRDRALYGK